MENARLRAAYYRGGTSKAVVFNGTDLPRDREIRDRLFLHILGSPDPYGRQLDGMGGGISSLSKVVIVEPSERDDADVDYTFVQIAVGSPVADYRSTCGNMSSCVGPFAVAEGMVVPEGDHAAVRIHNTNTGKIYVAEFSVRNGLAVERGTFEIPGVAGNGAKVRLDFLDPGGAATGQLLPTGNVLDTINTAPGESTHASMVDAANPVVFVRAADFGRSATESPFDLDADTHLTEQLETVRRQAAVEMGLADQSGWAPLSNPKIAIVAGPQAFEALDGRRYGPADYDIAVRLVSMGNFHRAITLTGAMCVAVAAQIRGTLVNAITNGGASVRIGNPSGVLPVEAKVNQDANAYEAISATTFRTQRRIMDGEVLVPVELLHAEAAA